MCITVFSLSFSLSNVPFTFLLLIIEKNIDKYAMNLRKYIRNTSVHVASEMTKIVGKFNNDIQ